MNITAIFVELLIIGFGVLCWLTLIVAYFLGLKISSSLFTNNPVFIAPLIAVAYILGIVADRLIRDPFVCLIENPSKKRVHKEYKLKNRKFEEYEYFCKRAIKTNGVRKVCARKQYRIGTKN